LSAAEDDLSFPRTCRLGGSDAYAPVFAFKCSVGGKFSHVYVKPNGTSRARFGVVTSKRIFSLAVSRNYFKRMAREVFRLEQHQLQGVDLVVRPRAPVTPAVAAIARTEMKNLLRQAQRRGIERAASLQPE
jgi:ribonuclease P protein component